MRNPFRTEAEAFRFLFLTIGFFALIVIGDKLFGFWGGLAVFLVEVGVATWWITNTGPHEGPEVQTPPPHPPGERRLLVIANETVGGPELLGEIHRRADGVPANVLVVSPALNTPVRHWVSDEDEARIAAQARLDQSLAIMRADGLQAHGEIGDDDPLQAIDDALRTFAPDELIISTHPEGRSNWLERDVVGKARERFAIPVTHVVVDLDAMQNGKPARLQSV
jgi:GABA permease